MLKDRTEQNRTEKKRKEKKEEREKGFDQQMDLHPRSSFP